VFVQTLSERGKKPKPVDNSLATAAAQAEKGGAH
jgi:hypothetical protein